MASASEAQRDGDLLQHISRYCEDAMDAAKQAGSEALFMDSRLYQHAVAMCILEIGELAKHLSEGFLQEHAEMPWRAICRMRDMYAHHYHRTDPQQLWATVTMDLPVLKAFCDQLHREYEKIRDDSCKRIIPVFVPAPMALPANAFHTAPLSSSKGKICAIISSTLSC